MALGGGDEAQTLAAFRAAKSVIDCEEKMDDAYEQLRHFLCENGAVQPVGEELVRDGIARAGQPIVRFPTGTQPILKDGPTTAAMLSDSSDDDGDLNDDFTDEWKKLYCEYCNKWFNSESQTREHK